jgi:hypothetical protein
VTQYRKTKVVTLGIRIPEDMLDTYEARQKRSEKEQQTTDSP